jgi:ATP-binding cassette subfamily F protein uup
MAILCNLKNINLSFGTKVLFKETSFAIDESDKIGLLGLNGKGKSTLFKVLQEKIGLDQSDPPFVYDKIKTGLDIFEVPQELPLEPNDNVTLREYFFRFYPNLKKVKEALDKLEDELQTADETQLEKLIEKQKNLLEEYEYGGGWRLSQAYESYLKYFGHEDLDLRVVDLSGGEQKKVLLSLGLSCPHRLVLWDEPTNHLDIKTIELFEGELKNASQTFILVTHDRYLLSKVTNKIFRIDHGKIKTFKGSYSDYLILLGEQEEQRKKLLERIQNSLRRETDWMRQGIKARGTRSKKRVEGFHDLGKKVRELKEGAKKELELVMASTKKRTKKLAEFKNVHFSYDNSKEIFSKLDFTLFKGDKIGLLGPNGVGKTTLVSLIDESLAPTSGEVIIAEGANVVKFSQKREELNFSSTPYEFLGDGEDFVHLPDGRSKHVASYFESFLFDRDELKRPLSSFSGGERNRLQMAKNLKNAADIWIFDEPTNDLDLETLHILEKKLLEFKGTLILISHDRAFLSSVTNKIWLINEEGFQVFQGGYSQVGPYLEALELEQALKGEEKVEDNTAHEELAKKEEKEVKKSLSNKEKIRLKNLPGLIAKNESEVERLEREVSSFEFSGHNLEEQEAFSSLAKKKEKLEEDLLKMYEEYEALS